MTQTTTDYGNGYWSYSGLTGEAIVEVATGLIAASDEGVTGMRVAQVGRVGCLLRQRFGLPLIAGGHALYVAADRVLPRVPITRVAIQYTSHLVAKNEPFQIMQQFLKGS